MVGERATVALGPHLHVAAVTARGDDLAWGQVFGYAVDASGQPLDLSSVCYPNGPGHPTFALPPPRRASCRILHGSCRRPGSRGPDALATADQLLATGTDRPHALFITGDLVYADSPTRTLQRVASELGAVLMGRDEPVPGQDCTACELRGLRRRHAVRSGAQVPEPSWRQLLTFGEYCALHVLSLSDAAWPERVPLGLRRYRAALPRVRRALANIATYTMFDDHEVTDDWYLTRDWCERVLTTDLGRAIVRHGLASYAAFHAWGNTPDAFATGPGATLLAALDGNQPTGAIDDLLSIPTDVGDALVHPPGAIDWHYHLAWPELDISVLDTRTMRGFPDPSPTAPPAMLSDAALDAQLPGASPDGTVAVVVVPSPIVTAPQTRAARLASWVEYRTRGLGLSRSLADVYFPDRGDKWDHESNAFAALLRRLARRNPRTVMLSGDIHFGYAARVDHTVEPAGTIAVFTASGLMRETGARKWRHRTGYNFPWPWTSLPDPIEGDGYRIELVRADVDGRAGREIVGRNHLGDVRFDADGATQTLWWHRRGDDDAGPHSPFRIALGEAR